MAPPTRFRCVAKIAKPYCKNCARQGRDKRAASGIRRPAAAISEARAEQAAIDPAGRPRQCGLSSAVAFDRAVPLSREGKLSVTVRARGAGTRHTAGGLFIQACLSAYHNRRCSIRGAGEDGFRIGLTWNGVAGVIAGGIQAPDSYKLSLSRLTRNGLAPSVPLAPSGRGWRVCIAQAPAIFSVSRWSGRRKGLPRRFSKINKINGLTFARLARVYQCCALKSSRIDRSPFTTEPPQAPPALPLTGPAPAIIHFPLQLKSSSSTLRRLSSEGSALQKGAV
jgi:hypothetical protein